MVRKYYPCVAALPMSETNPQPDSPVRPDAATVVAGSASVASAPKPGPALEPTRYGDWEKNGRCIDF